MDVFDEDLIGMVNFTDETVPQQMPVMEQKNDNANHNTIHNNDNANYNTIHNADERVKRVAVNCHDCPFSKKRSFFDRLRDMAKWMGICGSICMLLWVFEVNGLMAMEAAYPCILASAVIGGIGVGRSSK